MKTDLTKLSAVELRARVERGEFKAADVAEVFLSAMAARDHELKAWAFVDPDLVRAEARRLDEYRGTGRQLGPLHGIPVGLKDIIDTAAMPTANGTPIDDGRRPRRDATLVTRLKAAGALILGKTATTELAYYHPAATRNPHHPERTPGGSSSGSATAVAAGMTPLAVGTQTNGSVIRPASFCGVFGYKPTHGLIGRSGILRQSAPLDTVGVFAITLADVGLLSDVLIGHDAEDRDTRPAASYRMTTAATERPPVEPLLAFVKTPAWAKASADVSDGFAELKDALGERCDEVELPAVFENAYGAHRHLMLAGFAHNLGHYHRKAADKLSPQMRSAIEEGEKVSAREWLTALDWREVLNAGLDEIFFRYNAIVTPAAPGEAPGRETTGDPAFSTLWTFCGVPAVTLPLLTGANGLPIGIQLIGPRHDDHRLLRVANWLEGVVNQAMRG